MAGLIEDTEPPGKHLAYNGCRMKDRRAETPRNLPKLATWLGLGWMLPWNLLEFPLIVNFGGWAFTYPCTVDTEQNEQTLRSAQEQMAYQMVSFL